MVRSTGLILLAAVIALTSARNPLPGFITSLESNNFPSNNIEPMENLDDIAEPICLLDIQEVQPKKVSGRCIKLAGGTPGCAAGSYLHPLHPDCLANF